MELGKQSMSDRSAATFFLALNCLILTSFFVMAFTAAHPYQQTPQVSAHLTPWRTLEELRAVL